MRIRVKLRVWVTDVFSVTIKFPLLINTLKKDLQTSFCLNNNYYYYYYGNNNNNNNNNNYNNNFNNNYKNKK